MDCVACGWVRRRIQAQCKHDRQGGQSTINSSRTVVFWFGKTTNHCKTQHRTACQPPEVGRRRLRPLPWSWDSDSELDGPLSASRGRGEVEVPDDDAHATEPAVSIPIWTDQSQGMPQETDPPPSLLPTWVDMSRGDEVEAREPHRRRIMPGQGRVDPRAHGRRGGRCGQGVRTRLASV